MQMHEQPEKGQKKGAPVGRPSYNVFGLGRAQTNALGRHFDEFVFVETGNGLFQRCATSRQRLVWRHDDGNGGSG